MSRTRLTNGRRRRRLSFAVLIMAALHLLGCQPTAPAKQASQRSPKAIDSTTGLHTPKAADTDALPEPIGEPLREPIPLWENGQTKRFIDASTSREQGYLILDLGESWLPYLFSDGPDRKGQLLTNAYRPTYLALARGEFPNDAHGERAKVDKYLELYGIVPTLEVLRARMLQTAKSLCAETLDITPLQVFRGLVTYTDPAAAKREAAQFATLEALAIERMREQSVTTPDALDLTKLIEPVLGQVTRYQQLLPQSRAVNALQKRLQCEGFLAGKGKFLPGVMDWATHVALAVYERRHSVFSMGYLGKDSLTPLRQTPLEVDRQAVLRILTERAMHIAGVLEDGSVLPSQAAVTAATTGAGAASTFTGADGTPTPLRNLAAELRDAITQAFGLQSPETTLGWLTALGALPADQHRYVAIKMVPLPEYYAREMEITLDYDRGDVWYDFPYDDRGKEISQPVSRRPQVTVSTLYLGQKIPLARFGTTIGGWRTEQIDGEVMWRYKESPVGERAWDEIVASPIWLPPDGTPHAGLLRRNSARAAPTDPEYVVNYDETGPGYASAYGLVAAYHRTFLRRADGRIQLGRDEGIRTHGSVDYMSIMRRHSHGCHRLHNQVALRLMSFVLAHRAHERVGQESISFARILTHKERQYRMEMRHGGYVFKLATPLIVNVDAGRIRGNLTAPIEIAVPQWNPEKRAYVTHDGSAVLVRGNQLVPTTLPPPLPLPAARGRAGARAAATPARTGPAVRASAGARPGKAALVEARSGRVGALAVERAVKLPSQAGQAQARSANQ